MSRRRVVITGLGIVSPVGNDVQTAWANLVAGRSGISAISRFDASAFSTRIAGEVRDFDIAQYMPAKEARHFDTFVHYGIAAGVQALRDSGIEVTEANAERIGVIIGSGIGGLPLIENTHAELVSRGPSRVSPFFVPGSIINMVSGQMSIMLGLKGPNYAIVSACTTGLHCIGDAARMIKDGDADVMLAGGAEATISPLGLGGFCAARALSDAQRRPGHRESAVGSRPRRFRARRGRRRDDARGVRARGGPRGHHLRRDPRRRQQRRCVPHHRARHERPGARHAGNALRDAGVATDQIDYLNAHGTSTPLGDRNETVAIKAALGETAARKVVVNSTKSMTGHLLGGAGGIETVFTALAVHHQVSPPTINIFNQDPECDLDYCANSARDGPIDVAMSNSFGFGGTNGTLVMRSSSDSACAIDPTGARWNERVADVDGRSRACRPDARVARDHARPWRFCWSRRRLNSPLRGCRPPGSRDWRPSFARSSCSAPFRRGHDGAVGLRPSRSGSCRTDRFGSGSGRRGRGRGRCRSGRSRDGALARGWSRRAAIGDPRA